MKEALGGADKVADAMAPPVTWTPDPDPRRARLFELTPASSGKEYRRVLEAFQASLSPTTHRVLSVRRIENLALWKSYAAKRQTLILRGKSENRDTSRYERSLLFHGATSESIPKICEQGFNRSVKRAALTSPLLCPHDPRPHPLRSHGHAPQ